MDFLELLQDCLNLYLDTPDCECTAMDFVEFVHSLFF